MRLLQKSIKLFIVTLSIMGVSAQNFSAFTLSNESLQTETSVKTAEAEPLASGIYRTISQLIPDPEFAEQVRRHFRVESVDVAIPFERFQGVTSLAIFGDQDYVAPTLNSIEGMQYFENLEYLTLGAANISDITPLRTLTKMKTLSMYETAVADISPLANLINVKDMWLGWNKIHDITPLRNLTNITSLILDNNEITDITALRTLTNLDMVNLSRNNISDVSPLASLKKITSISLDYNKIKDPSPLAALRAPADMGIGKTFSLSLRNNEITDASTVAQLKHESLGLSNNKISDIRPLANLVNVKNLDLNNNGIRDIQPLANLTKLDMLELNDNEIRDVQPLANLTKLWNLYLNNNSIRDIQPLANLTDLWDLRLANNEIRDVSPLKKIPHLRDLNLSGNQIIDISPLKDVKVTSIVLLDQQLITQELPYDKKIIVENKVKDLNGSLITPNTISDDGVYKKTNIEWDIPLSKQQKSLQYTWSKDVKIGDKARPFSGSYKVNVTMPAVQDIRFVVDGKEYEKTLGAIDNLIDEPKAPTKPGYNFIGWYTDKTNGYKWEFARDKMPKTALNLYARFTPIIYVVIYENEGSLKWVNAKFGEKLVEPERPVKPDYNFIGWYTEDGKLWDFKKDTMPASNLALHARYVKESYTLTFDNEGEMSKELVELGASLPYKVPSKIGHTFVGWFTEDGEQWDFDNQAMPRHDLTLYARYTTNQYEVSFVSDAGTLTKTIDYGAALQQPVDPVKVGYKFIGWYTEEGKLWNFATDTMPAKNMTLVGRFEAILYQASFINGQSQTKFDVRFNDFVPAPVEPTKEGYTFAGWYTDYTIAGRKWNFTGDTMPASDLNLYAKFARSVTFMADDEIVAVEGVLFGNHIEQPEEPVKYGHNFLGWYSADGAQWNFAKDVMLDEDITLYAKYEAGRFDVSFMNDEEEIEKATVRFGDLVPVPADPTKPNYAFDGWYTEEGKKWDFKTDTLTTEGLSLSARFMSSQVRAFLINGKKRDVLNLTYGDLIPEPQIDIPEGQNFLGWFTQATDGKRWDFATMPIQTERLFLYARFEDAQYDVVFENEGSIWQTQSAPGVTIEEPTAPTKVGYTFIGWYTSDGNQWDFAQDFMPAHALILSAKYTINKYEVTYKIDDTEAKEQIDFGHLLEEPDAPTKEGYTFDAWYTVEEESKKWNFAEDTMPSAAVILEARFIANKYDLYLWDEETFNIIDVLNVGYETHLPELTDFEQRDGYRFIGWFTEDGKLWDFSEDTMPMDDLDLYGRWQKVE